MSSIYTPEFITNLKKLLILRSSCITSLQQSGKYAKTSGPQYSEAELKISKEIHDSEYDQKPTIRDILNLIWDMNIPEYQPDVHFQPTEHIFLRLVVDKTDNEAYLQLSGSNYLKVSSNTVVGSAFGTSIPESVEEATPEEIKEWVDKLATNTYDNYIQRNFESCLKELKSQGMEEAYERIEL